MNGKAQSISIADAAGFLKANDNYYILTHLSPDGDAMGSGFGLCFALRAMGKKANVLCSDPFPKRYEFLYGDYAPIKFTPQTIVTVDLADTTLFGRELQVYGDYVDLAIDHHISNTRYASKLLLDGSAAAACEVIYQVLKEGGMPIDKHIASCLYTGIATDSGCFKFENTTPNTHIIAAELMKYGFNFARINRNLFDIKSKARFMVEQYVINNLETYLDNKCAMIAVTAETIKETGLAQEEFEGLASIPMQLEGVEVGVTIKEKEPNKYKVSMRSAETVNVSDICAKLGGGGHIRAAGCTVEGDLSQVKLKLLSVIAPAMGFDLWLS